jgi:hypothetical protein
MIELKYKLPVKCNVCGAPETAKLAAESEEQLESLKRDVKAMYVCNACHNDPNKAQVVQDVLGINTGRGKMLNEEQIKEVKDDLKSRLESQGILTPKMTKLLDEEDPSGTLVEMAAMKAGHKAILELLFEMDKSIGLGTTVTAFLMALETLAAFTLENHGEEGLKLFVIGVQKALAENGVESEFKYVGAEKDGKSD